MDSKTLLNNFKQELDFRSSTGLDIAKMPEIIQTIEQLDAALTTAMEALEFYACTDNWISGRDSDFICDRITDDDENMYPHGYSVGGYRAREALAKIKETKK